MKEKYPLVSVITPAFNRAHTIKSALLSAMGQDYPNMEFIVINDGSTDNTQKIVESLQEQDERIKLINNPKNLGIAKSRNKGMEDANGEFFAVLDSDDRWISNNKITKQIDFLQKNTDVGLVGTSAIIQKESMLRYNDRPLTDQEIRSDILRSNPFLHSSVLYSRTVYEKTGGYPTNIKYSDDFAYRLKIGKFFKFANLPDYAVLYRQHLNNVSHQHWNYQHMESALLSLQHCFEYPSAISCITSKVCRGVSTLLLKKVENMHPGCKEKLKKILHWQSNQKIDLNQVKDKDIQEKVLSTFNELYK